MTQLWCIPASVQPINWEAFQAIGSVVAILASASVAIAVPILQRHLERRELRRGIFAAAVQAFGAVSAAALAGEPESHPATQALARYKGFRTGLQHADEMLGGFTSESLARAGVVSEVMDIRLAVASARQVAGDGDVITMIREAGVFKGTAREAWTALKAMSLKLNLAIPK